MLVKENIDVYKDRLFWPVWICVILCVLLNAVFIGVFVHNITIPHTWFLNPAAPGAQLNSQRGSVVTVSLRMAIISDILFIFCLMGVVAVRSNYGGSLFFMFMIGGCFLVSLYAITALGSDYSRCNGQDTYGSLCRDKRACCVETIRSNPGNRCPNPLPCVNPEVLESDLRPDPDFLGIFWIHFVNWLVFQMPTFIVLLYYWNVKIDQVSITLEPLPEKTEDIPLPPPPAASAPLSSRIHGLRQRK